MKSNYCTCNNSYRNMYGFAISRLAIEVKKSMLEDDFCEGEWDERQRWILSKEERKENDMKKVHNVKVKQRRTHVLQASDLLVLVRSRAPKWHPYVMIWQFLRILVSRSNRIIVAFARGKSHTVGFSLKLWHLHYGPTLSHSNSGIANLEKNWNFGQFLKYCTMSNTNGFLS